MAFKRPISLRPPAQGIIAGAFRNFMVFLHSFLIRSKLHICYFLTILVSGMTGQTDTADFVFKRAEVQLYDLQYKTFYSKKESERFEGNKEFIAVWDQIVDRKEVMKHPFSSLKEVSIVEPADGRFRLITWNIPKDDGTHFYFGYLLANSRKRLKKGFLKWEEIEKYEAFKLLDRSAGVKSPENFIGVPDKWFGMLYTQVVDNGDYYTLIGWDGNDKLSQKKFIDVLYFKSDGHPVFGKDVFRFPRKNPRRIMFEYSSEVSMSLRYQADRNMIIFNHLEPRERGSVLENQFQYYGPDAQFDAFARKGNKWVFVENVEANSNIEPLKNSRKPDPKKQAPIYKPAKGRKKDR